MTSIIIPVYNNLELTKQCIESVIKHTKDCEIIVIDNASTDNTKEMLEDYPVRYYRNEVNKGFAHACNRGILLAKGNPLLLNNDTIVTEGWLEPMLELLTPDVGIVGSCLLYPNSNLIQHCGVLIGSDNGKPYPFHPYMFEQREQHSDNKEVSAVTGACFLINKDILPETGLLESYKNGYEDIDFCLKAKEQGYKVMYCGKSVVYHYESMSEGRHDHDKENYQKFLQRWLGAKKDCTHEETLKHLTKRQRKFKTFKEGTTIGWIGKLNKVSSLSLTNQEIIKRLQGDFNLQLNKLSEINITHIYPPLQEKPEGYLVVNQPWEFYNLTEKIQKGLDIADEVWTPSNFCKDVYVANGIPESKIHVIPNGVDKVFKPDGDKYPLPKGFKFLFVGGTIFRKGIDILLEVFKEIDATLVIKDMGRDSFYKGQTADIDDENIIHITEDLTKEKMASLYRSCDTLVAPYRGEGFCLPVLEAIASGLSVITTEGGATDDYVTDKAGWKVKAKKVKYKDMYMLEPDKEDLKFKMLKAMQEKKSDPNIAKDYSWDIMAARIKHRIEEIKESL